jgi:dimethylamine/trimethylamine dehydrogenase
MDGWRATGPTLIFDDDGFYYGSVMAEAVRAAGQDVIFVTPADAPAPWTVNTLEFPHIQKRLRELDVRIVAGHNLSAFHGERAAVTDVWAGRVQEIACTCVLSITSRLPHDALFLDLSARENEWGDAGIKSVRLIGDALAPGAIVHAVYDGHRCARELGETEAEAPAFRRE